MRTFIEEYRHIIMVCTLFGIMLFTALMYIEFLNMSKDGVACASNPLRYSEIRMEEHYGREYSCNCQRKDSGIKYIDFDNLTGVLQK